MKRTLHQKLDNSTSPKRILSLDGGGIKGALTLGFVKRIETIIRTKHNDPNMVLSDYFDLIGGTSTGAIIAASLATGKSADHIADLYQSIGGTIFEDRTLSGHLGAVGKLLQPTFKKTNLEKGLYTEFGDIELCGSEILTGLCIVTKRADTYSTWPLTNNPKAKYNANGENSKLLLRQIVRASSAAPTYFPVEEITIDAQGQKGIFIDGGVSMLNNPALMLFMLSTTLSNFNFNWANGEDNILLVSLGTGYRKQNIDLNKIKDLGSYWAGEIPEMFMSDANMYNQMILQSLSNSPTAIPINAEIGNMEGDLLAQKKLLTYLRYNVQFDEDYLTSLGFPNQDISNLSQMDRAENRGVLAEIGTAAAKQQIQETHFDSKFNLTT